MTDDKATAHPPARPRAGGVRIGAPLGVPIYLAPSWFLVAGALTLLFSATVDRRVPGLGVVASHAVALVFVLLLYASVIVHELSHSVVALRLGLPVRRITVYLVGGVSELDREPEDAASEYLVAMAGPLVSLILAGLGTAAATMIEPHTVQRLIVEELALANGLVAFFNLLPGLPLDGGRVLRAAVWRVSGSAERGAVVAGWSGRGLAVLVGSIPFLIAMTTRGGASLISLLWFSLLAAFLWSGASQALRLARLRLRLPRLTLAQLTRSAVPVTATTPVSVALAKVQVATGGSIVVVDAEERPIAVVSEAAVAAVPAARRPWVPVADVSVALAPERVLDVDLCGEALLAAMRRAPASEYLVVDRAGEVVGVLATTDVARIVAA